MSAPLRTVRTEVSSFARFCIVGAIGFLVDAGLLLWFNGHLGLDPFLARGLSICLAITMTWAMHRLWTFGPSGSGRLMEWARFAAVSGTGGGLNFLVYSGILIAVPATAPLAALVAGSAAALGFNYLGSRLWAYRARHDAGGPLAVVERPDTSVRRR